MGVIREHNCYTAPCKVYSDGLQDNSIRWYFVPDDRPFYTAMHVFSPRVHDGFEATGNEYEKTGMRPNPRTHNNGLDYWLNPHVTVQGDPEDFRGLAPRAKYNHDGIVPEGCCEEHRILLGEILFGGKLTGTVVIETRKAGLDFGGRVILPGDSMFEYPTVGFAGVLPADQIEQTQPAVKLAAAIVAVIEPVEALSAGIEVTLGVITPPVATSDPVLDLALSIVVVSTALEAANVGLDVAAAIVDAAPSIEAKAAGLALAAAVASVTPSIEAKAGGLKLAAAVASVTPSIEAKQGGIDFAAAVVDASPSTVIEVKKAGVDFAAAVVDAGPGTVIEVKKAGVKFGDTVVDVAPPMTPGPTCAAAGVMVLGTSYTFNIAANATQWFTFPVTGGTTYHVKLVRNSGFPPGNSVSTGASCSGLTFQFALDNLTTCNTFNVTPSQNCYVQLTAEFFGGANYTIVADTGACPP